MARYAIQEPEQNTSVCVQMDTFAPKVHLVTVVLTLDVKKGSSAEKVLVLPRELVINVLLGIIAQVGLVNISTQNLPMIIQ